MHSEPRLEVSLLAQKAAQAVVRFGGAILQKTPRSHLSEIRFPTCPRNHREIAFTRVAL